MTKRGNGATKSKQADKSVAPQVTLLDLKEILFQSGGETYNVEDASDEQFDKFIRQHIKMGWSLEDRRDAINFALQQGYTLALLREEISEKIKEKSNEDLIFSESETAQEASV